MYRLSQLRCCQTNLCAFNFGSADLLLQPAAFNLTWKGIRSRWLATPAISDPVANPGASSTTLNADETNKFENISGDWWNPNGDFKPLHSMNTLRVEYIRNGFRNNNQIETIDTEFPLKGLRLLDIGCGGGILSQPLGRLGANVTGLDTGKETIRMADLSLPAELKKNVQFVCSTVEEFIAENPTLQFDGVVASEVIEHVQNPKFFLQAASQCVKPSGSIFLSTINRTNFSWLGAIVAAEYLFRIVPMGTHEWNKFISPEEIQSELDKHGCRTCLIHGMNYNVICNSWSWTRSTSISYVLHAVKDSN